MIYLDFAGKEVPANLKDESTFRSKHTGAELKSIKVDIVAEDQEAHERLLKSIERAKKVGINSTDGKGTVLNRWKVKNTSYSYTTGVPGSKYYHSLELEEMEELKVSSLALGGLSLQPYSYEEKFDGDALIIKARVLLSEKQYAELKELMKGERYFPVIRHGISDEPREMRFGTMRWSKHEDSIKHELLLVERSYDEAKERFSGLFEPEMSRMQHMIADHVEILEELFTTLINKGLLEVEEASDIRARAAQRIWERKKELYRVDDIDKFA